jgi:hypothetical protein
MTLAYKRNITIKDLVHITILLTDLTTSLKQKNMSIVVAAIGAK